LFFGQQLLMHHDLPQKANLDEFHQANNSGSLSVSRSRQKRTRRGLLVEFVNKKQQNFYGRVIWMMWIVFNAVAQKK
jgi:hypothetical protein